MLFLFESDGDLGLSLDTGVWERTRLSVTGLSGVPILLYTLRADTEGVVLRLCTDRVLVVLLLDALLLYSENT